MKTTKKRSQTKKSRSVQTVQNMRISELCSELTERKLNPNKLDRETQKQCIEFFKYGKRLNNNEIGDIMDLHRNSISTILKKINEEFQEVIKITDTYDREAIAAELTREKELVIEKLWEQEEYFLCYKILSQWVKDLQSLGVIYEKPQELNINNREDILNKFYEKLEVADLETLLELMQEIDAGRNDNSSDKFKKIDIQSKKRH